MKFKSHQKAGVLIFVFLLTLCSKKEEKPDETPPVLSVTPVDISTVTSVIVFGDDLSPQQKNPAFEYRVNSPGVEVRAVSSGSVEEILLNDNFPDYEVWIKPSPNSIWTIIYDHVLSLNITKGDELNPGDIIGVVGTGNRTELQINRKTGNNEELSYCPFDFGTSDFIQIHKSFQETWCIVDTVTP